MCDIHDGMDLVFGMQNMIETEGGMSARDGCYRFINRSIAIYPTTNTLSNRVKNHSSGLKLPFVSHFAAPSS